MPPMSLGVSPDNTIDFYMWNESVYFIQVQAPNAILGVRPGGHKREAIKLLPRDFDHTINLDPHSKYPKPPTQEPASHQDKKVGN